jgi:DNA-binding MarR family transcriptional regulator
VNRVDSRSKFLRLSAAGKRAFLDLIPRMNLVEQEILSPLDPQEVQTLLDLMARVRTGLAKQKPI